MATQLLEMFSGELFKVCVVQRICLVCLNSIFETSNAFALVVILDNVADVSYDNLLQLEAISSM